MNNPPKLFKQFFWSSTSNLHCQISRMDTHIWFESIWCIVLFTVSRQIRTAGRFLFQSNGGTMVYPLQSGIPEANLWISARIFTAGYISAYGWGSLSNGMFSIEFLCGLLCTAYILFSFFIYYKVIQNIICMCAYFCITSVYRMFSQFIN